jgi:hypothetical protein
VIRYAIMLAVLTTACSGPIEPSPRAGQVDPRLAPVLAVLDSIDEPLPWNGETFRSWRARLAVPVVLEPLDRNFGAVWTGSAVILNADLTGYDDHGKAALIAHELRHADGIRHDCGPYQDRRATEWSAYDVQIWTLTRLGEYDQAKGNESGFCD